MYLVIAILAGVALGITLIFGKEALGSEDEVRRMQTEQNRLAGSVMRIMGKIDETNLWLERIDARLEKTLADEKGGEAE